MLRKKSPIAIRRIVMSFLAKELVCAYHVLARLGLDDHTYTHLSCRTEHRDRFYLPVFGRRFEEVSLEHLLEIGIKQRAVLKGCDTTVNITAYGLHADTYAAREEVNVIFHLHTPEIVAVSANPLGLRPVSQWALHFYGRISYYDYDSLLLEQEQSQPLIKALGPNNVLLMRHHGALILGRTVAEAVYYTHHLQKACVTQCLVARSCAQPLEVPHDMAQRSAHDLLSFEEHLGERDWQAWKRLIGRQEQ
jgi:ribulose-5-phosphate 4-epimerase/fuculose-1-phosphate aldolase